MKKLFSTSLLILAGMLLLLGGCKEDELPVSGEGNVANNELPVRLAETDYNPDKKRTNFRFPEKETWQTMNCPSGWPKRIITRTTRITC